MSALGPALDIKPWIEVSEGLRPSENLALVGLLVLRPQTPPGSISKDTVVRDECLRSFERWAKEHFRQALRLYCDQAAKSETKVMMEFIKTFAPFLVAQLSLPIGAAIGFLFWCGGFSLERWCGKYETKRFSGKGQLLGNPDASEIDGFFSVTHRPPIYELVVDPEAYPIERFKVDINVPEITSGMVKVPTPTEATSVFRTFSKSVVQSFEFEDDKTEEKISGDMETVAIAENEGPNVLSFSTGTLKVGTV